MENKAFMGLPSFPLSILYLNWSSFIKHYLCKLLTFITFSAVFYRDFSVNYNQ